MASLWLSKYPRSVFSDSNVDASNKNQMLKVEKVKGKKCLGACWISKANSQEA